MKRTLVGGLILLLSAALAGSGCSGYYGTSVEARYSSGYHTPTGITGTVCACIV